MLVHRLRRWTNVKKTLIQRIVSAGKAGIDTYVIHQFLIYFVVCKVVVFYLKGLAQAKIIKKSVILFRVLNMTI